MPKLDSIFGFLEKLENTHLAVEQNRCVVVRNRNVSCERCAEACTSGCISIKDNRLEVAPDKCIGCGTCATACPTGALVPSSPKDRELLDVCLQTLQDEGQRLTIICNDTLNNKKGMVDPEKVVGVRCLGRIDESLLTSLVAAGVQQIELVSLNCASCDNSKGKATTQAVCAATSLLLSTWKCSAQVSMLNQLPASVALEEELDYDLSRRNFFLGMKDGMKRVAATGASLALEEEPATSPAQSATYTKVQKDGTLPSHVPLRQQQVLENLTQLGHPEEQLLDVRVWGQVIIDEQLCDSCLMCATFCSTGAIQKYQELDGSIGVTHTPHLCAKCHSCEDICRTGALSLSSEVIATDIADREMYRYEMTAQKNPPGQSHSIWRAMRDLIGNDQVYER